MHFTGRVPFALHLKPFICFIIFPSQNLPYVVLYAYKTLCDLYAYPVRGPSSWICPAIVTVFDRVKCFRP